MGYSPEDRTPLSGDIILEVVQEDPNKPPEKGSTTPEKLAAYFGDVATQSRGEAEHDQGDLEAVRAAASAEDDRDPTAVFSSPERRASERQALLKAAGLSVTTFATMAGVPTSSAAVWFEGATFTADDRLFGPKVVRLANAIRRYKQGA